MCFFMTATKAMILQQSISPVCVGMAVDIGGAMWLGHFLQNLFAGAKMPSFPACLCC
jgi:hypothetical protein